MKYTDFLKLRQPEFGDPANILDISENMGALDASAKGVDTALKELQDGSLSREEFGQFVTDLAAEMVKYGNAGTTNVDNVKAALDWVYSSLANKVDVGTGEAYELPLNNNFRKLGYAMYTKNQLNEVWVYLYITRTNGVLTDMDVLGSLPVGFRPKIGVSLPAIAHQLFTPCLINISASGSLWLRYDAPPAAVTIYAALHFTAA